MTNKETAAGLDTVVRDDQYWLEPHDPPIGPYETKAEALDDLKGVKRFYNTEPDDPIDLALDSIL